MLRLGEACLQGCGTSAVGAGEDLPAGGAFWHSR